MEILTIITDIIIILLISVGVAVALLVIFPCFKNKGVQTEEIFKITSESIDGVDALVGALKIAFPKNTIINVVDKIISYAEIGVNKAEQLYRINEINGDKRKREAIKFVYESLELAGIDVTDEIEPIVDGAIEASVMMLGHKK